MDGRVRALALDQAEHRAGRRCRSPRTSRGSSSGAGCGRRGSRGPPRRSRRASSSARAASAARSSASSPSTSRSASSSGASNAAARTCPSRTRGFAWSRIAASTRRPSSVSGSRMKYWSSASSLRDEHREPVAAAPGAAPLLPEAGDRAREAGRDHAVEQADVDPELERVGRGDAEQLAGGEPLLDLAPLRRACSRRGRARAGRGTRGRAGRAVKRWISSADLRLFAKQSVRRPRSTSSAISRDASPSALARSAELLVEQRRVPERDRPLGTRRRVVARRR